MRILIIGFSIVFGWSILLLHPSYGQMLQYSNETFTPLRVNPAAGVGVPLVRGGVQYRYNTTAASIGFHTARISGSYPIMLSKKAPMMAISASLMRDMEAPLGMFQRQEYTLAYGIGVPVAKKVLLSAGFQAHYHDERVLLNDLTTGSQYLPGRGYNPELANGEDFGNLQHNYWSLSTGLQLTWFDREMLTPEHELGFAIYDLNRPPLSFLDNAATRQPTMIGRAALTIYKSREVRIRPDVLFQTNGDLSSTVLGVGWGWNRGTIQKPGEFWVHTRYRWDEALILGASFRKESFTVGYTYDFSIARSGSGLHHTGAHEIALRYEIPPNADWYWRRIRKKPRELEEGPPPSKWNFPRIEWDWSLIKWPKWNIRWPQWLRCKKRRTPSGRRTRRRPRSGNPADSVTIDTIDSPAGEVEIGQITPYDEMPTPDTVILDDIVKHFYFETNRSELDTVATQYLDSLLVSLTENPDWLVDITGHTDDVGDEEDNRMLSRERALAVGWYLARNGVSRRRIRIVGAGETEPLVSNDTPEGRANNRRVEITIYRVPPE